MYIHFKGSSVAGYFIDDGRFGIDDRMVFLTLHLGFTPYKIRERSMLFLSPRVLDG